jgi:hypothetical protein
MSMMIKGVSASSASSSPVFKKVNKQKRALKSHFINETWLAIPKSGIMGKQRQISLQISHSQSQKR